MFRPRDSDSVAAIDFNRASIGREKAENAFHQHGLATAGSTKKDEVITEPHIEINARQDGLLAKGFPQAADADQYRRLPSLCH